MFLFVLHGIHSYTGPHSRYPAAVRTYVMLHSLIRPDFLARRVYPSRGGRNSYLPPSKVHGSSTAACCDCACESFVGQTSSTSGAWDAMVPAIDVQIRGQSIMVCFITRLVRWKAQHAYPRAESLRQHERHEGKIDGDILFLFKISESVVTQVTQVIRNTYTPSTPPPPVPCHQVAVLRCRSR